MKHKLLVCILALALMLSMAACVPTGEAVQTSGTLENQPSTSGGTTPTGKVITAEEAQSIALKHAGLTADQVTGLRAEYDMDDGVPEYEVEFRQGNWEYEYEIHAQTGEIRSYDRDD